MAQDYKLCPKCNNALDNNVLQCPYCGEKMGLNFGASDNSGFNKNKLSSTEKKKSGGCGCGCLFLIIFFILPLIGGIISFLGESISSILDESDGQQLSELKEVAIQEFGDLLGLEDSDLNNNQTVVIQEDNVQRILNSNEVAAMDEFDEIFETIENLNYPEYKDKEGWDVEIGTSTFGGVNDFKRNIVMLKYRGSEYERYFLQLDEENGIFFFDDEKNDIHRVTENEVLDDILPVFMESLSEVEG